MPLAPPDFAKPSIASVSSKLRDCLCQLDQLGLHVPASHVDHALALIDPENERRGDEFLRFADGLYFGPRPKGRLQ